jgi:adenine-specific DNA-methyltransferase
MPTLDWIGKKAVVNHHREVPYHLLKCDKELSVGDPGSGNLLVQGDNLLALKALLPYYAGRVKCIYIDPPYNTGNENWVYNDAVNSPEMRAWLGKIVGDEKRDLSRHDKWLCMMYPRLWLLKQYLHNDGSLFISIGEDSVGYLRLLLNEIFHPSQFVATVVWQKRYSRENREAIGDVHDYIIVYAKDRDRFKAARNQVSLDEKSASVYKNPNNDPRGRWRPIPMTAQGYRPNQMYKITTPAGAVHKPPAGRCWSMIESEYEKLLKEGPDVGLSIRGRIWFGKKGKSQPNVIRYLDEVEGLVPWTWWPHEEVGHTDEAKKEMFPFADGNVAFDTPKPERLIQRIIEIATNKGDLVLDCFAGSGTTGAVAHKMERQWIMVESEEFCRTLIAKRLKAVLDGSDKGGVTERVGWNGGGGFRYCRLGAPVFDETGNIREGVTFSELATHVYFTETGEPIPTRKNGKSPFLGVHNGKAIYLLFNGILGDRSLGGGNVLTNAVLKSLPPNDGPRVIYGEGCRLGKARLKREGIVFKQIPYGIKVS